MRPKRNKEREIVLSPALGRHLHVVHVVGCVCSWMRATVRAEHTYPCSWCVVGSATNETNNAIEGSYLSYAGDLQVVYVVGAGSSSGCV